MPIVREKDRIRFIGEFGMGDLHRPLACIHKAVTLGYQDIVLDFTGCMAAFPAPMLALCAQVLKLRESKVDFELLLPNDNALMRLFKNANWAHLIEPSRYPLSSFRGHTQVAATQFTDAAGQGHAVDRIVSAILGAIPNLERADFAALEWSINEITDNVIVHSESPIGGLVQVSTFLKNQKRVEYIVADAGLGIPSTLRSGRPELASDTEALDSAIREGVTRDKSIGQGNGLFGSYEICNMSGGQFQIESGHAKLSYAPRTGLSVRNEVIPIDGTIVVAQVDFSNPKLLEDALRFAGKKHTPLDFIETKYEQIDSDDLVLILFDEAKTFGSRAAGAPVRIKLSNLLRMCPTQRVVIDCSRIPLVSSSFADELFGKLFVELGQLAFKQRVFIKDMERTVHSLVDRAINQRAETSSITKI